MIMVASSLNAGFLKKKLSKKLVLIIMLIVGWRKLRNDVKNREKMFLQRNALSYTRHKVCTVFLMIKIMLKIPQNMRLTLI